MRKQRIALEHHVDGAPVRWCRRDIRTAKHYAAFVGSFEAGENAQQRGLAAARWAEQRKEFIRIDVEAETINGGEGAKTPRHVDEPHQGLNCGIRPRREAASHRYTVRPITTP